MTTPRPPRSKSPYIALLLFAAACPSATAHVLGELQFSLGDKCVAIEQQDQAHLEFFKRCGKTDESLAGTKLTPNGTQYFIRPAAKDAPIWYWKILASGDLEVRDKKGPVTTMNHASRAS